MHDEKDGIFGSILQNNSLEDLLLYKKSLSLLHQRNSSRSKPTNLLWKVNFTLFLQINCAKTFVLHKRCFVDCNHLAAMVPMSNKRCFLNGVFQSSGFRGWSGSARAEGKKMLEKTVVFRHSLSL